MVRLIIAAIVVLVLVPTGVYAEHTVGLVGLYADAAGTDCRLEDRAVGLVEVHIIAHAVPGLNAIQFAAPIPECWTGASWVADESPWELVLGNTQDPVGGIAMTFRGLYCDQSTFYLGKIVVSGQGTGQTCCVYPILKATGDTFPEISTPITVLCGDDTHAHGITPMSGTVNRDSSCACMITLPVEETSWGRLKSLYE